MSSRAVRKALKKREQLELQQPPPEVSEPDIPSPVTVKPNLFAMLSGSVHSDDNDDNDDKGEWEEDGAGPSTPPPAPAPRPAASKSKKKKKKSKSRAAAVAGKPATTTPVGDSEDEIDKALRDLNLSPADTVANIAPEKYAPLDPDLYTLLKADSRAFDSNTEFRRLFGRTALAEYNPAAVGEEGNPRARRRGGARNRGVGGAGGGGGSGGRNIFIQPNQNWPPNSLAAGLSMEVVEDRGAEVEFAFRHSKEWQETQVQFMLCVKSNNHHRMLNLLEHNRGFIRLPLLPLPINPPNGPNGCETDGMWG